MNPDYIELVNFIQDYPPQNKKAIYSIYKEYIPKNNKWNKYIKSRNKERNKDLIKHIKNYYECSAKEAKEYLCILDQDYIKNILSSIGLEKKEITKLIKS